MQVLPSLVYLLCAATSALCLILLVRSYRRHHTQLLLWSALCFAILALAGGETYNNL